MNERFQDLAKQAFGYFPAPSGEPELEKFAKLIVDECAYMARQCPTVRAVDAEDVAQHIEKIKNDKYK